MSLSFTVARLFGIPLRIHALFLVLVVPLLAASGAHAGEVATFLALLFASVLLHELGHSLVARAFGARILDITLWPLGGLSRMEGIPESPRKELVIALSGPAANAAALLAVLPFGASVGARSLGVGAPTLDLLATIQASLALFNLIPAFPMDGGRALRALLTPRYGPLAATELAVRIGRWFTALAVAAAMFVDGLLFPVLIVAAFLLVQGWIEMRTVRARHGKDPLFALFQRATQRARPEAAPPPKEEPPAESKRELQEDLEQYRGTLEEFFEERKKGPDRTR